MAVVVVMDQGRIRAIGRHEELIRQDDLYARLAALQFGEPALTSSDIS